MTDQNAGDGSTNRPLEFSMPIQGELLDNLGINMYSNLGKCLVEFAANAYDSDSPSIDIDFDAEAIAEARDAVRKKAIAAAKAAKKKRPTFIEDALPSHLTVVIRDRGHGMSPQDIQTKFLPINRNRRKDQSGEETETKTEAGKRFVMGRKGIGKLSAFGAASTLIVRSKRKGDTFATEIKLELLALKNEKNLADVKFPASYIENQPVESHGTTLTMRDLKCDSMKFKLDDIEETLLEAFYPIRADEFDIKLNGVPLARPEPDFVYVWPENLKPGELAESIAGDEEKGILPFKYVVNFREKSLKASRRGARVYCNGRLAFGPSLINLNTGTHNFMAHQYMECVVEADELDRQNVDLISTDRGDIRRNNDLVDAFLAKITDLMQAAIAENSKFKEHEAGKVIDEDPRAVAVRDILQQMPANQRSSGRKIVNVIVARHGIESPEFETIAPLLVQTMSAGEVLVDLIKASVDPKDVKELAGKIINLREIEKNDALKIYRARKNGIHGLRIITNRGEDDWGKGKRNEAELHRLLKKAPWLVRPDLAGYLSSDTTMTKVVDTLAKTLAIDEFSPPQTPEEQRNDNKRPDLVFILGDAKHASRILIVELKSTNIALEMEHLNQLKSYIRRVEDWFEVEYAGQRRSFTVEGMLIGAMPDAKTKADGQRDLLSEIRKRSMAEQWEVVGLHELLARTEVVHRELIEAIEAEKEGASAVDV